jgi:SAM-dependent methyltransferase
VTRAEKREAWRDERVAGQYEMRRFARPLARLKHRRDAALVLALLAEAAGVRSVLDLPCGTGRLLPALARAGYRAVGADVALEMMRAGHAPRARGAPLAAPLAVPLVQADAARLPFSSAAFDAVVSLRFLFHLTGEERRLCLAEMRRVAEGGAVVGEVRYRWTLKHLGRWLRHFAGRARRYRPSHGRKAIERELFEAGLELVRLRPVSRLFSDKAFFLARTRERGG